MSCYCGKITSFKGGFKGRVGKVTVKCDCVPVPGGNYSFKRLALRVGLGEVRVRCDSDRVPGGTNVEV